MIVAAGSFKLLHDACVCCSLAPLPQLCMSEQRENGKTSPPLPFPPSLLLLSACWIMVVVQENSLRTSPLCLHPLRPTSPQNFAEMLPTEMSVQIFGELDAVSLCSASQTCRLWHHIIETSEQLWRKQCLLARAVCQREVDGDRRDGLSWKVSPHRLTEAQENL